MIPNGGLPSTTHRAITASVKVSTNAGKRASEIIALENRNWLIHFHYSRREFGICNILIKEELKKSNGMNEYANYVQAVILRHEGKIQESLEYFQKCHTLNPKSVCNIKQVARSLSLLGRQRLALEAFNEAKNIAQKPEWDIYHNLGVCLLSVGDIGKAKELLRQAVQFNRHESSFIALAKIHILEDDIPGAIGIYNAALETSPDSLELATSLGLLYMRLGEHQKAFERFGSALAQDPNCSKALLAAGAMMQNHKEHDTALSKYKIASIHIPESPALWNNIGMCFYGKKKFVAAISCLKRASYLAPFDWKILYNLGLVHLATQQYASAFHFLSSAVNLQSKIGSMFLPLAITLAHLKDLNNARHAFEQATIFSSGDPTTFLNFALFLYKQGEISRAIDEYKRFQSLAQSVGGIDNDVLEVASTLRKILNINPSRPEPESKPPKGKGVVKEQQRTSANKSVVNESRASTSNVEDKPSQNENVSKSSSISGIELEKNKEKSLEQGIATVGEKLAAIAVTKEMNDLSPSGGRVARTEAYEMAADEV